ncbi:MAG TPA: peroxiredoxin-like family protein [Candidatus Baltobacteraceae bacterium]|nr:peroxiredoxin-like family protein [Candidatus Baltobacteraceae bacterium]
MREVERSFESEGITVRFVAIGDPNTVRTFCARFGEETRCIADPDKRTYKAMGLGNYNLLRLFTDGALRVRRNENKTAGFRQNWKATRIENSAQLPGAAFFDRDGVVRWVYRGQHPGDLPPIKQMLGTVTTQVDPRHPK